MSRARLLLALILLVPAGLLTKASESAFVRGYLGGVLYVVFFTYAVLLLRPRWPPARVALGVLLVTCAIEAFQLCRWPEGLRATFVGGAFLGSEFDPWDFPCYAVGAAAALAGARVLCARSEEAGKPAPGASR